MKSILKSKKAKYIIAAVSVIIIVITAVVIRSKPNYKYVIDARDGKSSSVDDSSENKGKYQSDSELSNTVSIDPFEGLSVSFDGVSPFCTVSINNSKCTDDAQQNVIYSLSPDTITTEGYFGINDNLTVYASIRNNADDDINYILSEEQKTYTVNNVPHYLTEINEDTDLTQFTSELNDYLASITAFKVGEYPDGWFDGWWKPGFKASKDLEQESSYFSILKKSSYDKYPNETDYVNKINITFSISMMSDKDENWQKRYFTICAKNIIQYPDGTIGWGKDDPKDLNFEHNIDWNNMESLINSNITSTKDNYNVTDISTYMNKP